MTLISFNTAMHLKIVLTLTGL